MSDLPMGGGTSRYATKQWIIDNFSGKYDSSKLDEYKPEDAQDNNFYTLDDYVKIKNITSYSLLIFFDNKLNRINVEYTNIDGNIQTDEIKSTKSITVKSNTDVKISWYIDGSYISKYSFYDEDGKETKSLTKTITVTKNDNINVPEFVDVSTSTPSNPKKYKYAISVNAFAPGGWNISQGSYNFEITFFGQQALSGKEILTLVQNGSTATRIDVKGSYESELVADELLYTANLQLQSGGTIWSVEKVLIGKINEQTIDGYIVKSFHVSLL